MKMCYQYRQNQWLWISLLFLGLTTFSSQAFAQSGNLIEDVRCTGGSCLTGGYEKYDAFGSLMEIGTCTNGDCATQGWQVLRLSGLNTHVVCNENSCFENGFSEVNTSDNSLVSVRACNEGDCLLNGWVDHTFIPEEIIEGIHCNAQGCDFGFITEELSQIIDENNKSRRRLETRKARIESRIAAKQIKQNKIQQQIDALKNRKYKKRKCKKKSHHLFRLVRRYFKIEIQIQKLQQRQARIQEKLDAIVDPTIVLSSKQAFCISPGGCFSDGYMVYTQND